MHNCDFEPENQMWTQRKKNLYGVISSLNGLGFFVYWHNRGLFNAKAILVEK